MRPRFVPAASCAAILAATCLTTSCSALGSLAPSGQSSSASSSTSTSPSPSSTTAASTETDEAMPLNPNTASEAQIRTALEKAGVSNAADIAHEIKARAPYTSDNFLSKVQDLVTSTKVSPGDIDRIRKALNL